MPDVFGCEILTTITFISYFASCTSSTNTPILSFVTAALEIRCRRSDERDSIKFQKQFLPIATSREMFGLLSSCSSLRGLGGAEQECRYCEVSCSGNHISVAVNTGSQSLRLRQDNSDDHADVISPFHHRRYSPRSFLPAQARICKVEKANNGYSSPFNNENLERY